MEIIGGGGDKSLRSGGRKPNLAEQTEDNCLELCDGLSLAGLICLK